MLIIIKSAPDTPEGKRGISLAGRMGADVVLLQDAVRFAAKEKKLQTGGRVYMLEEDAARLLGAGETAPEVLRISYGGFVDLLASQDKVQGMF
ncbi:MAG: DsrH/TusB family sulfur metabolism protein [Nitrospiraceae bacterium]|nr:DsrH/TusB family sulfur metabolism protein [Nitrospiraceae bacterium]